MGSELVLQNNCTFALLTLVVWHSSFTDKGKKIRLKQQQLQITLFQISSPERAKIFNY